MWSTRLSSVFTHADHVKVSSVANVPGLHAMTGISGKLTDEIEKSFPDNKETHEGTDFVNKFLKQHNIHRAEYQGSHSFEGNHARKLLRVAHEMRPAVEQLSGDHDIDRILRIISVMEAFDEVVESFFIFLEVRDLLNGKIRAEKYIDNKLT